MKEQVTRTVDSLELRAMFTPSSINEADKTIDVTFATSTPVRTFSWEEGGSVEEVLSFDEGHIRLQRLNSGAPLLDNHDRYNGVRGVLGVVLSARVENGVGVATLKFSNREDVSAVWQDVKDGVLRGISVGYKVYTYEVTKEQDKLPKYRAIDWEPYEISFAPVQADMKSAVRSTAIEKNEVIIINNSNKNTDRKMETPEIKPTPAPVVAPRSEAEIKAASIALGMQRAAYITDMVRKHDLEESFATNLIKKNVTKKRAAELILAEISKRTDKGVSSAHQVTVGKDEDQKRREGKVASLLIRSGSFDQKDLSNEEKELARDYRSQSLLDVAKDSLLRSGLSLSEVSRMDKMEIARRSISNSTSDFPVLLEGTARRVLLSNYKSAPDTWRQFCKIGSVSDFREFKRLRFGSLTRLDVLNENGEYKNKTISDAESQKIQADTFGNTINVTRKMIINDDLQGFSDLAQRLGRASARSIEIDVYSVLGQNSGAGPLMSDNKALFHVEHKNLIATGVAPSVTAIDAMRVLMAQQTDKDNNDFIDVRPSIALAPITLESAIKVINDSQFDPDAINKIQKPNSVKGLFSNVVGSPRLGGTAYYAFANPSDEAVMEVAFLDGQQTPFLESEEPFDIDGLKWKVRLDYGVGAIGFRGAVRNPGA